MLKNIEIGEIFTINNREWVMVETTHKNGSIEWLQPTLILLEHILKGINKKPYYKRNGINIENVPSKRFKIITAKIGGKNENC